MTISITKSTVGGSENTWGTTTNQALDDIVDVLNGNTASTPDLTAGSWKVGGTAVTADAAEINKLDGVTATTAELNYTDGVSSNIQTQLNAKAPTASPTFTGTANIPTANVTTVDLGDWTITQSGSDLKFAYQGTDRLKLSSAGALTVEDNVTAYGSA
tara:strand:+ start:36 stop:509 length:474 start_codon:yes stop_codon:yes gene_type:complete